MMRISFGYSYFILPWAEGVQVLNLLKDAVPVAQEYRPEGSVWKRTQTEISAHSFDPVAQAQVLMGGE